MKHKVLIVGGSFDKDGGRPSSIVNKMINALKNTPYRVAAYNGGGINSLHNEILPSVQDYSIVFWMPNVPNDEAKMRNVKEINPVTMLISSKRNDNQKYSFSELINRALSQKSNLVIEFSKGEEKFNMRVFDPLGNVFYDGTDIDEMMHCVMTRVTLLSQYTRVPSLLNHDYMIASALSHDPRTNIDLSKEMPEVPNEERFFAFARGCSDIFHNLINPDKGVTRFLGNMSFRCQNGFPSFRGKDGVIYVSRRNVDKREINKDSFVPTYKDANGYVIYYGTHKPSVDTPVQQRLYELFPHINYMLHAHCYIDMPDTVATNEPIPCGAIEEVGSVCEAIAANNIATSNLMTVNLMGHGCIIMAASMDDIDRIPYSAFVARPMPEDMSHTIDGDLNHETQR